jgi:hypothetical protein
MDFDRRAEAGALQTYRIGASNASEPARRHWDSLDGGL